MANPHPVCKFPKGKSANPGGKPKMVYQPYEQRVTALANRYTIDELIALASDKKRFGLLHPFDAAAVTHLINSTINNEDIRLERAELLNRIEGKPREYIDLKTDNTHEFKGMDLGKWANDGLKNVKKALLEAKKAAAEPAKGE